MSAGFKRPESVLVVIHTPDLQILLLERAKHPGYWQSVTGSREDGELFLDTAIREVREETGLQIHPEQLRIWPGENIYTIMPEWRHRYAPDVTHNRERVFSLCLPTMCNINTAPDEHRAWRWLPCEEAATACFSASNREAILALNALPPFIAQ
ncbi:MAG: dihydroneopterin triphosphate diphosphatase [Rhodocyclaceae bacterium]|nr:dihydroneopterin triphosphate diphosphatase [Rhodocyclaceae bacterium]